MKSAGTAGLAIAGSSWRQWVQRGWACWAAWTHRGRQRPPVGARAPDCDALVSELARLDAHTLRDIGVDRECAARVQAWQARERDRLDVVLGARPPGWG